MSWEDETILPPRAKDLLARGRPTFEVCLGTDGAPAPSIRCLVCDLRSYHPEDVRRGYCGNCCQFHGTWKRIHLLEVAERRPADVRSLL